MPRRAKKSVSLIFITMVIVQLAVISLVAVVGYQWFVAGRQKAQDTAPEVKVMVLVPIADLLPYTAILDSKQFVMMEKSKRLLRESMENTITSFDQIKEKSTGQQKLRAQEPLCKSDFIAMSKEHDELRPGNSLVAYHVLSSLDRYPEGHFKKGDRVDILPRLFTLNDNEPQPPRRPFTENVEVYSFGFEADKYPDGTILSRKSLVLLMTRVQAVKMQRFEEGDQFEVVQRNAEAKSKLSRPK